MPTTETSSLIMSSRLSDFSYIETLSIQPVGRGRLFLGKAARFSTGRPVLLFVHGGYHGAWCFSHYLQYFDALGIPAAAIDMRGHGGLPQAPDFPLQGVRNMAEDVIVACESLPGPPVPIGHSVGALVAAAAGEVTRFHGYGLLAPSPPGQQINLRPLPMVPEGQPFSPPDRETAWVKFLGGEAGVDLTPIMARLCPESPRLLNDRYSLRIHIDPAAFGMPAICISVGRDLQTLHPAGQDHETARFFGAEYHRIDDAPHCMMLSAGWRDTAMVLEEWYRRLPGVN